MCPPPVLVSFALCLKTLSYEGLSFRGFVDVCCLLSLCYEMFPFHNPTQKVPHLSYFTEEFRVKPFLRPPGKKGGDSLLLCVALLCFNHRAMVLYDGTIGRRTIAGPTVKWTRMVWWRDLLTLQATRSRDEKWFEHQNSAKKVGGRSLRRQSERRSKVAGR